MVSFQPVIEYDRAKHFGAELAARARAKGAVFYLENEGPERFGPFGCVRSSDHVGRLCDAGFGQLTRQFSVAFFAATGDRFGVDDRGYWRKKGTFYVYDLLDDRDFKTNAKWKGIFAAFLLDGESPEELDHLAVLDLLAEVSDGGPLAGTRASGYTYFRLPV